ncbi:MULTISPECIES: multiple monosaccharide ABC transporter permease [Microbacterium]|uniref:multiple monosaccharide ABC transporter permease n=1 Tax=Microbacterium TaxID=33882 RepID=UPI001656E5E3|nr:MULTISPECIES: multiple monosaccharide ABC transporter permease [Microbacterium]MCT1363225.1 sugar ABC transporter permease [Microbacterium sp. p3-SID131]MCT1377020.1 sugar ABC transporter permease [Microbacterium sp. p3-SID337]MCZ0709599.1 sugar ABC transporter permease [Microbacterium paraoxydans]MDH5133420.1 sugar ABC transporter permease [Microbacterium sp. RD10]MDH5137176.1 sugar ABC transporter permease [Microbacterium sp. RD11]
MTTDSTTAKRGFHFKDITKMFGGGQSTLRQFGILGSLVVILVVFQVLTWIFKGTGLTLSSGNLINVVNQYSYILILAIGMVMVIIMGHIDLSVGSVAAFTGIVVAKAMQDWNLPWPLGILLGLGVGVLVGAWQGFWVAYVGVPAFIVTLAGMLFFRGANQAVGDSQSVPVPEGFKIIGAGYLPEIALPLPFNIPTMLLALAGVAWIVFWEIRTRRIQRKMGSDMAPIWVSVTKVVLISAVILIAGWLFATGREGTSFPISGVILLALVILYSFITNNTVFGRHIYAVGGNRQAARLSGVKDRWVDFFVMMNMSVLASLAGMIYVARATASGPQDGNGWELDAIASVFIGGAAVSGGIGTVIGSIIGGLVMAFLNNGLALLGAGADVVSMIKGLVLLFAVGVDVWNKQQGRPSITGFLTRRLGRKQDPATDTFDPTKTNYPTSQKYEAPAVEETRG